MTVEPEKLSRAREHLRQVEADLLAADADYHLEEGMYLLEELTLEDPTQQVAENVGRTYFARLYHLLEQVLSPRDVPEPTLKHLLRLAQRLGATPFASGADPNAASLTATVAQRYIDAVFEGYSETDKQRLIGELRARLENGDG